MDDGANRSRSQPKDVAWSLKTCCRHLRDTCEQLGLTYLVVGSIAKIAYGEPRFTNDVDIVIDLPSYKIARFCAAFPDEVNST